MSSVLAASIVRVIDAYADHLSCHLCGVSIRDLGRDENKCICGITHNKFDTVNRIKDRLIDLYGKKGGSYEEQIAGFIFGLHTQKEYGVIALYCISENDAVLCSMFEGYIGNGSLGG
jgi:hypothetical protein